MQNKENKIRGVEGINSFKRKVYVGPCLAAVSHITIHLRYMRWMICCKFRQAASAPNRKEL